MQLFSPILFKAKGFILPHSDQHLAILAEASWFYSSVCLSCEFLSVTTAVALCGHSVLLLCQLHDSSNPYQTSLVRGATSEPLQVLRVLRSCEDMCSLQVLICVLCRRIHVCCESTKLCMSLLVWMAWCDLQQSALACCDTPPPPSHPRRSHNSTVTSKAPVTFLLQSHLSITLQHRITGTPGSVLIEHSEFILE